MTSFRAIHVSAGLLAAAMAAFLSNQARAACISNAECEKGFSCEVVGGTACAGIACAPGQPCPEPPPCMPQEIRDCVPAACSADADCADGMVCHSETVSNCVAIGAPACAPNENCGPPPPVVDPACTESVVSQCMPRYLLGCTTAADCGEGFDCVAEQLCPPCMGGGTSGTGSSGGSAGSAGSGSAGFAPPPTPMPVPTGSEAPPPDTTCACSAGPNMICQRQDLPCTGDAGCPTNWTCAAVGGSGTCGGMAPASDPSGGAPFPGPTPTCTPVPAELKCVPPYYGIYGFPETTSTSPSVPGGATGQNPPGAPASGTATSGPLASPFPAPALDPNAMPMATEPGTTPAGPLVNGRAGCQLATNGVPTSGLALGSLVGFASLLLRRRARRV